MSWLKLVIILCIMSIVFVPFTTHVMYYIIRKSK